jgi:hypothetical protein
MKKTSTLSALAFFVGIGMAQAQPNDLVVKEKVGNETSYVISNLRKLSFSSGNLIVTPKTGNPDSYATANLDRLFFKQAVTGVATEEAEAKSMGLYPNPVLDLLRLRLAGGTTQVQIQDMQGKVWMSTTTDGNDATLDVVELPAGLYACLLKNEKATKSIKFLKQ